MKKIRWMTLCSLLLSVVVLMAGCLSSSNDVNQSNSSGSGNKQTTKNGEETLPPITYSFGTDDNKISWDTPITKKVTEKTGVSLDYDVIVGDLFQKWDIWLASGDYPDILRLDTKHLQKYVEAEAVIPLEDLIDQYGPNIKEKFGDNYDMLKNKDGHIYSLFSVNLNEEAPANKRAPFVIQYAVLEEAGFPEIKTLDQLFEIIKAYQAKHPEIDGRKTIGFAGAMDSFTINFTFNNSAVSAAGLPDHGRMYEDANHNMHWNPVSEITKDYYEFLNKLSRNDLYDIEAFSMDLPSLKTKFAQGRILAAYAPAWVVDEPNKALKAAGEEDRMYAHLPLLFDENTQNRSVTITPVNGGSHEWAITENAKNPERIIQFIDYLFSDEGQILTSWGIEGAHFELVDGKRVVKEEWFERKKANPDAMYEEGFITEGTGGSTEWFSIGNGAKLADGDYATPLTSEIVRKEYNDKTKEVLNAYGKETWADFLPKAEVIPGYIWQLQPPEETLAIEQRLYDAWRKATPKIVLSKTDEEFETEWNTFVTNAENAGLADYERLFSEIWKEFIQED